VRNNATWSVRRKRKVRLRVRHSSTAHRIPLQYLSLQTSSAYKNRTPSSRSLSLSLTYFKHLQHISLSLHSKHLNTTPSSCSLSLSLTHFKRLQHITLSLSALQTLYESPHPSSRSLSLSIIFRHLQHISFPPSALQAPANHHTPPLAPSRSL